VERPRRRHRKRDSFAFRDVTNQQQQVSNNGDVDGENNFALGKTAAVSSKSFEPVPKSLREKDEDVGLDNILGIESEEAVEKKSKTWKKRRMSLLLPSDDKGTGLPLAFPGATDSQNGDVASKDNADSGTNNNSKEVLVQLVRDYCSLPVECRVNSKEANKIDSLSGYPMPGKILPFMDNATTKEEFLLRVQPIVQEMENRKQKDVADTKLATQCEVKKNGKGGYCYYDVNSGEQIQADEYKLRYAAMVDERHQKRKTTCRVEECSEQGSIDPPNNLDNAEAKKIRFDHDSIEQEKLNDSKNDDSNMDMDESVNMDDSMMSLSSDGKTNASPSIELDDSLASEDSSSTSATTDLPIEIQSEGTNEPSQHHRSNHDSHLLLAGMPTSNDPRVIAARRKLWRAVDAALANYSQEILAMEETGGAGSNP